MANDNDENEAPPRHRSPLAAWQQAIRDCDVQECKKLLEQGVPLSCQDLMQRSPLHMAVNRGSSEIVKMLLVAYSSIQAKAMDGFTCLHLAVRLFRGLLLYTDVVIFHSISSGALRSPDLFLPCSMLALACTTPPY